VLFLPHLLNREVAQALAVVAVVVVLGATVGAPLGAPANPGASPNPTKAPWYFVGFQELLIHLHPVFAVLVVPLTAVLGLLLLPYIAAEDEPSGRWFLSRVGRRISGVAALLGATLTAMAVVADAMTSGRPGWFGGGVVPFGTMVGLAAALAWAARRFWGANRNESIQAVVVSAGVSFVVLTLVGALFRGPGMDLVWPWMR
jgi:hypothetical protein